MDNKAIEKIINTPIVYNVTEEGLTAIENKWSDVPDCTTKEGYKLAKAGISEVKSIRTSVEKRRKELKSEALQYGKNVDSAAKEITARLVEVERPMKYAKLKVDTAKAVAAALELEKEKKRVLSICGAIDAISNAANVPFGATMDDIKMSLVGIENEIATEEKYQEFTEKAVAAKSDTVAKLTAMIEEAAVNEAKERELKEERDRVAAEQAAAQEKLRIDREEFEATQKAEQELREAEEAERVAKRAKEQAAAAAERDKEAAKLAAERAEVEAAKEAVRVEKQRLQDEQDARDEEAKVAADLKELGRVRALVELRDNELRESRIDELSEWLFEGFFKSVGGDGPVLAAQLASEIIKGNIPNVKYEVSK